MKAGGKTKLKIAPTYGFGEEGHADLGVPPNATLLCDLELVSFTNEKDSWDLKEDEKLDAAEVKKANGNQKAKSQDWGRALRRYEAAKTILASDYKMDDEQKEKCKAIKVVLFTNMAMVHAKAGADDKVLPARAFCLNAAADCLIIALYLPYNCLIIAL